MDQWLAGREASNNDRPLLDVELSQTHIFFYKGGGRGSQLVYTMTSVDIHGLNNRLIPRLISMVYITGLYNGVRILGLIIGFHRRLR